MLSHSGVQGNLRTLKIYITADLSDLQQNIARIMGEEVDFARRCGERVLVREASIQPAPPASSLMLRLHYERWTCSGGLEQSVSTEIAESDGVAEIRLVPAVDKGNVFKLVPQFQHIEASGMMADALRTGNLGADLLQETADVVRAAAEASADFKVTLPAVIESGAMLQKAEFQDIGAGSFTLLFEGEVQISGQQANLLASQLNQALSAQGSAGK
jgi:hypothetical protein